MSGKNELSKQDQGVVVELNYLKNEQLGTNKIDRKVIFDIYCENESGENSSWNRKK